MSGRRIVHAPALQGAKAATKALIRNFGGQEAAAAETGRRQQHLSDIGLPNTPDFATIDLIDAIEAQTEGMPGWPNVTNWLCRQRGGVFVQLPTHYCDEEAAALVIELMAELGDVSREVTAGYANDHRLDADEARRALDQLDDHDRVSAKLRAALTAIAWPARDGAA